MAELHPKIYLDGWLAYLTELGIPTNNLTETKATPKVELSDSSESYSSLILFGFSEEKYMNQLVKRVRRKILHRKVSSLRRSSRRRSWRGCESIHPS